jgi:RpiR family carbohydrate utilization transcriptional regulator
MSNFTLRLQAYQANFSEKEQKLAQYLLDHQALVSHSTISDLSQKTGISTATISRFAKTLGFTNFQDLKLHLVQNNSTENLFSELSPSDSAKTMAGKIFKSTVDALNATENALSDELLNQCIELILKANQVGLFGLGASNIVALNGYHKFLRTTMNLVYASDFHMQIMGATRLTEQDVMILVSHSGENRDAIALAKLAQKHHVPLILITGSAKSTLAGIADISLISIAEESLYRPEALHSLIAQISIMDALFMMTAIKTNREITEDIRQAIDTTRLQHKPNNKLN